MRLVWATGFAVCLLFGLAGIADAQDAAPDEDPHGLLVPEGLKRQTESPPRTRLGEDVTTTFVGKLVSIRGNTLTILEKDREREFQLPLRVRVVRDDKPVRLADLQPHDVVRVITDGDPNVARSIAATSPAPTSHREPDRQLLQERRDDLDVRAERSAEQVEPTAGRVWIVVLDPQDAATQAGVRPGDMIMVVSRSMIQSETALEGLSSGLFPLRANADGKVVISPNAAGVSILGTAGVAVPTGVTIGTGATGTLNPNVTAPNAANVPDSTVGDENFGPPIGRRPNPEDRNFGPPIGSGNNSPQGNPPAPTQGPPSQPQSQPPQAPGQPPQAP